MDTTTLVILLISLMAAVIAGIVVLYKRQNDPSYIQKVKEEKNNPLMQNSETMQEYMGRQLSAIPYAIILVLVLVLLAKCGVV
jgi:hypothetical protein